MKVVTTRLEERDEKDLGLIEKEEKADRAAVVRKLLATGIHDWKKKFALEKLKRREITINKAAEIASVTYSDMLGLMAKEGIDIGYSLSDLERDFAKLKRK